MPDYKFCCFDREGRITVVDWISAADDSDALRQARWLKKGAAKCELWLSGRLVVSFDAQDFPD